MRPDGTHGTLPSIKNRKSLLVLMKLPFFFTQQEHLYIYFLSSTSLTLPCTLAPYKKQMSLTPLHKFCVPSCVIYRAISQTVFMLSIAINRAEHVCATAIIKYNYMLMCNHKIVINIMLCLLNSTGNI